MQILIGWRKDCKILVYKNLNIKARIIDDTRRFYSPISDNFIQELMSGKIPIEKPYLPQLGENIYYGKIEPINKENYELASLCTGRTKCKGCNSKIKMYQDNLEDIFGFVNIKDNEVGGGAEFFPSIKVPYNIPKAKDIAFITCVYSSDEYFDYKTKPLEELEKYLSKKFPSAEFLTMGKIDF